jgi:hypothetical protein
MEVDDNTPTAQNSRGQVVNSLTMEQLTIIIDFLLQEKFKKKDTDEEIPYMEVADRGFWRCNLAPTKDTKGNYKYPQFCLKRFKFSNISGKQLVHLIVWRYQNKGQLIDSNLHISHCDADHSLLNLVQESPQMNESRKYCHLFGWYSKHRPEEQKNGKGILVCPHYWHPCTGPSLQ